MDAAIRRIAQQVIETEAQAAHAVAEAIDEHFERAIRLIEQCQGTLLTSGIGKAGIIARKVSASFSSTGTPSHFLDPAQAVHGDVGAIRKGDVLLILSDSGETEEILRMLSIVKKLGHAVISITSSRSSSLALASDVVLSFGRLQEACPLGLAPSASTTAMLVLGDALFLTVMQLRNFTADDFALYHPAGQLGRKLMKVSEAMTFVAGKNLAMARDDLSVGEVLHDTSNIKRRSGAVVLLDPQGKISGLFSDGDLRRLITDNDGSALRQPIRRVMTHNPKRVRDTDLASHAMAVFQQHRIDELPVVDAEDRPVGLIDVQDLVVLKMFDVQGNS